MLVANWFIFEADPGVTVSTSMNVSYGFMCSKYPITLCLIFQAEWEKPFDPKYTKRDKFFVDGNKAVEVPMMFGMGLFKHGYDEQLSSTVVQMDYKGGASAFFVLPDQGKMRKLEKKLSCERMARWRTLVSKR